MTQEQKEIILSRREAGVAYGKIAQELGLSVNTIKSFCQRTAVTTPQPQVRTEEEGEAGLCKYCGKPIIQIPGRRPRKYCSVLCRMRWWGKYGAAMNRRHPTICHKCGKKFYGKAGRKYCSHACYIAERFGEVHDC